VATKAKAEKPPEDAVQAVGEAEAAAEKDGAKGPARVESFDVYAEPHQTVLTLNGTAFQLDREALLAVAKLLNAARIETNY
jgi:hypothetical protein